MTEPVIGTTDGPGSPYSRFLERLRARPVSFWRQDATTVASRTALAGLAALGWDAERRPGRVPDVPYLGPHALADQLTVLLTDCLRADADPRRLGEIVVELAEKLRVPIR